MNSSNVCARWVAARCAGLAASAARGRRHVRYSSRRAFQPDKLAKIGDFFSNEVATGKIPGAVLLIQQHGKPVYLESFGVRDVATRQPMTPDTIFRIYSMSKADHLRGGDDAGR